MKLRAAVELWTSPADRRAPFGACGQPVDNVLGQVAVDRRIERLDDDLGTRHGGCRTRLAHDRTFTRNGADLGQEIALA